MFCLQVVDSCGSPCLQVDEDVQRHNELLEVVKRAPSEINEVVARRRKDFTKEFFLHVHTVAESYYDNPTEQNGEPLYFCSEPVVKHRERD